MPYFVDNMVGHVEEVSQKCGLGLVFGQDIKKIAELLNFITEGEK